jgi:hypothetical protein
MPAERVRFSYDFYHIRSTPSIEYYTLFSHFSSLLSLFLPARFLVQGTDRPEVLPVHAGSQIGECPLERSIVPSMVEENGIGVNALPEIYLLRPFLE